jgi:hypothetical protein
MGFAGQAGVANESGAVITEQWAWMTQKTGLEAEIISCGRRPGRLPDPFCT